MKRHLASTVEVGPWEVPAGELSPADPHEYFDTNTSVEAAPVERNLELASVSAWTHTLILTGELTHRSAHALEGEIERLCEQGVTGITLDLRDLAQIDSTGVVVIAFRRELCERRGYEFTLIPGSQPIRRAFEQAGVPDSPSEQDEAAAPRARVLALAHRSRDEC